MQEHPECLCEHHESFTSWCCEHFHLCRSTAVSYNVASDVDFAQFISTISAEQNDRILYTLCTRAYDETEVYKALHAATSNESIVSDTRFEQHASYQIYVNELESAHVHAFVLFHRSSDHRDLFNQCESCCFGRLRYQNHTNVLLKYQCWGAANILTRSQSLSPFCKNFLILADDEDDFVYCEQLVRRLECICPPPNTNVVVRVLLTRRDIQSSSTSPQWSNLTFLFNNVEILQDLTTYIVDERTRTVTFIRCKSFWPDRFLEDMILWDNSTGVRSLYGSNDKDPLALQTSPGCYMPHKRAYSSARTFMQGFLSGIEALEQNVIHVRSHDCVAFPESQQNTPNKVCLFTVVTGEYEDSQIKISNDGRFHIGCECFYFSDSLSELTAAAANGLLPMFVFKDGKTPKHAQREVKAMPHRYLPRPYDISIYVDGNAHVLFDHIDDFLTVLGPHLHCCQVICYQQPTGRSVSQEADVVIHLGLEHARNVNSVLQYIKQVHIQPSDVKVSETNFIVRKHNEIAVFSRDWRDCMQMCRRDQISFDCLLEKHLVRYVRLPHCEKPIRKYAHMKPVNRHVQH